MSGVSGSLTGSGGQSMDLMLKLLADPEGYQAKLKELQDAEAKAAAIVALVGEAEAIPALHDRAYKAHQAAQSALNKAQEQAKAIIDNAVSEASRITIEADGRYASAQLYEQEVTRAVDALMKDAREKSDAIYAQVRESQSKLDSDREEIAAARRSIESDRNALALEREALTHRAQEIERRLSRMGEIWSGGS